MNSLQPLIDRFPRLFRGQAPFFASGVGDGWLPLLVRLFERIDTLLTDVQAAKFRVVQIKENFGDLCVYFDLRAQGDSTLNPHSPEAQLQQRMRVLHGTEPGALLLERVTAMVGDAQAEAVVTCERCGAPGTRRYGLWVKTLCQLHEDERQRAQRELEGGDPS